MRPSPTFCILFREEDAMMKYGGELLIIHYSSPDIMYLNTDPKMCSVLSS